MSMEEIIRAWKADEETVEPSLPASPVGRELSEQELLEVAGSAVVSDCWITCFVNVSCPAGGSCNFHITGA